MSELISDPDPLSAAQLTARVVAWWHEGRLGGSVLRVTSQSGSAPVLQQVREEIPESLLVDAAGADGEDVFRRILTQLGARDSELTHQSWRRAADRLAGGKLVLIANASRAGHTRRSSQPALVQDAAEWLTLRGAGVIVDAGPQGQTAEQPRRGVVTLTLDETAPGDRHSRIEELLAAATRSQQIQALALSEPRWVPFPVWNQLVRASGFPDSDEDSLRRHAARLSDLLTIVGDQVAFTDEAVPEALRRDTPEETSIQVNRHMTRWLREIAPRLRHPDGWASSGPVGQYAARGLAMHAVQSGDLAMHAAQEGAFEELLSDGQVLANLPQSALMDAAHCAFEGSLFGCNPAADAVFLQMNGVQQSSQAEWAAWLHLMATAREDAELCRGIESSGVRMPWKTLWTHWCPPGGYDPSYLLPGPVDELFAVRWKRRPAVAATTADDAVFVWDLATSELLAGPWRDEDFPRENRGDLSWDTDQADDQLASQGAGPTSLTELRTQDRTTYGPGEDYDFLHTALDIGNVTVVAGVGGLLAMESTDPHSPPEITPLAGRPLLGLRTAAGAARPKHAPKMTASDLGKLFPHAPTRVPAEHIPAGLTDEAARRVLMDIGVPEGESSAIGFWPRDADFLEEVTWPTDVEQPEEETGPFFHLALWMGGKVVIDGPSGHVLRLPHDPDESGLEGVFLAHDLDRFLTMLVHWTTGLRILRRLDNSDEAHLLRQHIDDAIWDIDSKGSQAGAWKYPLHNE